MYIMAVIGNVLLIFLIVTERSLHEPMYFFLSMLALADVLLSTATAPKMLAIFWFHSRGISFGSCVSQMFFIHFIFVAESAVLLAMAFDRYVAICYPLRYTTILTSSVIGKIGTAAVVRSFFICGPFIFLVYRLLYCGRNVLSHSYCLHQDMIRLACADIRFNVIYGLVLITLLWGMDSLGIFVSYVFILLSVLKIASREGRLKALNTCASHICAVLILYVPMIGLSIVHRFAKHSSPLIHIFMAHIYLMVPPVLNPIIYSVKTKQIRQGILHLICSPKISSIAM
ncbi:Olfactory receptor 52Z1P [Lemmus lemmus]